MTLARADVEAMVAELRARAAAATAAADGLEQIYLGAETKAPSAETPIPGGRDESAVRRDAPTRRKYTRRQVAAAPEPRKLPPPTVTPRRKASPTVATEPANVPEPTGDGARLRDLRKSLAMSQSRVGEICGFQQGSRASFVSLMEMGKRPIPPWLFTKLRELLIEKKVGDRGKVAQ